MILTFPYFDLLAPKGENHNLPCDVVSYSLGDGYIHLLLPEDVPKKAVVVYIRDIDGNYLARRVYDFTQEVMIGPWEVLLEHHTLPVLYFETEDHAVYDMMNASETKDIICNGNMHLCVGKEDSKENGWYREYISLSEDRSSGVSATLQGRGSTSWLSNFKKSYSLRLGKSSDLLGMGSNKNWNLIGNSKDVSLLKNVTFNEISKNAGIEFQPRMRSVNLYVDGVYQGLYTLTSKVSADKERVALRKGDYFYRLDPPVPDNPIPYYSDRWFWDAGVMYPVADLMYPESYNEARLAEAAGILQTFVTARDDPAVQGFDKICDLDSLARFYWIQEASMNYDACSRSIYMYYRRDDSQMHFGPVWDMDLTIGCRFEKQDIDFSDPTGWKIRNMGWYQPLFERDDFVRKVWEVYYNGGVRSALISGIDEFETQREGLGEDAYLNYTFYGHANSPGVSMVYGDSYDEYCDNMILFYRTRIEWLDAQMQLLYGMP